IGLGQSKKKKIASLNLQIDSLNVVLEDNELEYEREYKKLEIKAKIYKTEIENYNDKIYNYNLQIEELKVKILALNERIDSLNLILNKSSIIEDESYNQDNSFLTDLFQKETNINNQNFKLMFVGVINTTAQKIISSAYNSNYMSEVLYLNELEVAQQFKSDEYIENSTFEQIKEKCTWNWSGNNFNLKMVSPLTLDYFPTFSFLKGKLLTIADESSSKDYLFSISHTEEHSNYGYKEMHFNLTDDNEKGYIINTIIIEDQAYIILNQNIMNDLDFKNKFTNETQFKLIDNYNGQEYSNDLKTDYGYITNTKNYSCKCDNNYFTLFRKQSNFMKKSVLLYSDKLNYLFKLVEEE
ncbi:MAG: hypothetical protein P8N46_04215, partial [Flavobacteriales bacterium]|nr:hypothetical protein [Flavobacteriales bacterium]